jgi:hypothetical protein
MPKWRPFLVYCLCALCPALVSAQGTGGTIAGRVTDSTDAGISEATVTVRSLGLGLARTTTTDSHGFYRVTGLPLGPVEVRAERDGFAPDVRSDSVVTVARECAVDLVLAARGASVDIDILSSGGAVDLTTPTLSSLADEKTVRDLPLNGRDLGQLVLLQPGVVPSRGSVSSANNGRGAQFSVAGSRPNQNLFILDGTMVNDALNTTPGNAQGLLVGVESVQEFRVLTHLYPAEYGRATGGVVVAVTKSGTNELHGSVFEFLRDDALDARNFFDREKPEFRRNQFGFTLGGPIVARRSFFFGSYEGLRESKGITKISLVPDDQARMGRLPGERPLRVDPRSQPILDLFPRANGDVLGDGTAEFIGTTDRTSSDDYFTARLDYLATSADSFSARYVFDDSEQVLPRNFPEFPNQAVNRKQSVALEWRRVVSPSVVNEARFGFNRATPAELVPETAVTLQLIAGRQMGEVSIAGLAEVGTDRTNPKLFFLNDFQFADDLSVVRGRHFVKLGGLFERLQYNGNSETRSRGQLRFESLADFLEFEVDDLQGASSDSDFNRGFRQSLLGVYVQDEFRLTSRLTLSGGLRVEGVSTPREVNKKVSNLRDVYDTEVLVGGRLFKHPLATFAPRVGFAYDVFGDGRTALRGGFGLYHDQPLFHIYRSPIFRSLPFVNRGRLRSDDFETLPVDPALFEGSDSATEAIQYELRPSYVIHYNLNVQREVLPRTVLSVAYIGSRGINLIGTADINTAIPEILPDGREFFAEGSERRNPEFDAVRSILQGYSSSYHSLNVAASGRAGSWLHFQSSYTWGKSIDDSSGQGRQAFSNGQARTLDPYNRRLDRARSNFDIRHAFVAYATCDLPFGDDLSGAAKAIAGGWQLNVIATLYSGIPFTPFVSGDPDRDATDENTARPDLVAGVETTPAGGRSPDLWFNPAMFSAPAPGLRGNAGRNILTGPDYRSLDVALVKSIQLGERVRLQLRAEAFNVLNRANFDLPANSEDGQEVLRYIEPDDDVPARFETPASVGRIFSTVGDSREIQFALKITF